MGNYRIISVLPCFCKTLERIMYNRLFKYLTANIIFDVREGHSTEHAVIQLIYTIKSIFEKNHFILDVFIDLLITAFDAVDHHMLIKKLNQYRVKGNNIRWFKGYLHNRKHTLHLIINAPLSKK